MAPKKEKLLLMFIKKSQDSKKTHSVLFEKFTSLHYKHFEVSSSCSFSTDSQPSETLKISSSSNRDKEASSSSLPSVEDSFPTNLSSNDTNHLFVYFKSLCDLQERCKTLERKLEMVDFLKGQQVILKNQAPFSPLENGENKQSTPLVDEVKLSEDEWNNFKIRMYFHKKEMLYSLNQDVRFLVQEKAKAMAEEKQVFISSYLQDLHIYLSVVLGLRVPGLKLVKDMEFDNSKLCRIVEDPLIYQQGSKQLFCKYNKNFMISWVC